MMRVRAFAVVTLTTLALLSLLPGALGKEPKVKARDKDLTDNVLSSPIMTKFAVLLRASDLDSFLSSRGPFTFFAPTDSAFSKIPPPIFDALQQPQNKEVLQRIVLFHVVNGQRLTASDLLPLKTVPSCEGSPLPLRVTHAGDQIVGKAKILRADIKCVNGLMHEIDTVLVPPGVSLAALAPPPAPDTNAVAAPVAPTNAPSPTDSNGATAATNSADSGAPAAVTNWAPTAPATNSP